MPPPLPGRDLGLMGRQPRQHALPREVPITLLRESRKFGGIATHRIAQGEPPIGAPCPHTNPAHPEIRRIMGGNFVRFRQPETGGPHRIVKIIVKIVFHTRFRARIPANIGK